MPPQRCWPVPALPLSVEVLDIHVVRDTDTPTRSVIIAPREAYDKLIELEVTGGAVE